MGVGSAARGSPFRVLLALEHPLEDRVARVLGDALAAQERQVGEVEVVGSPAEDRRVEGDHDRAAAACLGAAGEALDELVRGAPVELEEAGGVAELAAQSSIGREAWLENVIGDLHAAGCPRHRQVGVAVHHLQHADRREHEGGRVAAAEELDAGVALRHVAEHPRHDPPSVEVRAVGGNGPPGPRAAGDVGVCLRIHRIPRARLERRRVGADVRSLPAHPTEVDGLLAFRTGRHRWIR